MKPLGQVAYEASGWQHAPSWHPATWEQLPPSYKASWEAVAQAVSAAIFGPVVVKPPQVPVQTDEESIMWLLDVYPEKVERQ